MLRANETGKAKESQLLDTQGLCELSQATHGILANLDRQERVAKSYSRK